MFRSSGVTALILFLLGTLGFGAYWYSHRPSPPAAHLTLESARFTDLPGWTVDDEAKAWPAFLASCQRITRRPPGTSLGLAGTVADWVSACAQAKIVAPEDSVAIRDYFERFFTVYQATDSGAAKGLFTGYYEPELHGSRLPNPAFPVPLYRRPTDLVTVNLGDFRPTLKGQRIVGRVVDGRLKPYDDRAKIVAGSLANEGLELVWVASAVNAFFLQIQGSGQIDLPDGTTMRVGYNGQNGRPYVAIGKLMVQDGLLEKGKVTLQSIKAWLVAHPDQAGPLMARNPSYVFFRDLGDGPGPIGAEGVALTPGRSLAVDRKYYPLGLPMWLDTTLPAGVPGGGLHRLMIAQDTGGAIRGPVRGDIFFGAGEEAEWKAGAMQQSGRLWLLLPLTVKPQVAPAS